MTNLEFAEFKYELDLKIAQQERDLLIKMNEIEKCLSKEQWAKYIDKLWGKSTTSRTRAYENASLHQKIKALAEII